MRVILVLLCLCISMSAGAVENLGIYGKVYEIAEEDILERIKNNATLPKITKKQTEEKIRKSAEMNVNLPVAKKDNIRKEIIIYKVPQDIVIEGKLIAKKGTKINVLKKIRLSRTYIVLADYMLPDFVEYGRNGNIVYLITRGNIYDLEKKYPDLYIYGALPQVIKALKVKKIPSIIYQENDRLVIYEKGYPDGKAKTNTGNIAN